MKVSKCLQNPEATPATTHDGLKLNQTGGAGFLTISLDIYFEGIPKLKSTRNQTERKLKQIRLHT